VRCRKFTPPLQGPNGVDGVDFLGRVVTPERIERERSIERKKRKHVEKLGGDRKSDQDLESGLVSDEQVRAISLVHQHANGANPKQSTNCLHNTPTHASNQAANRYLPCLIVFRRTC
jgi:hypothetical protein